MVQQPLVRICAYPEHVAHALDLSRRPRQEVPFGCVSAPLTGVLIQYLRRVVRGIERNRQQHEITAQLAMKTFPKHVEVVGEAKAEIRQRTGRVNEIHSEEL